MLKNIKIISLLTIMIFVLGIFTSVNATQKNISVTLIGTNVKEYGPYQAESTILAWYTKSQQTSIKVRGIRNQVATPYYTVPVGTTHTFHNMDVNDVVEIDLKNASWYAFNSVTGVMFY